MGIYKGLFITMITLITMTIYTYGEATQPQQGLTELQEIIGVMQEKQVDIDNWTIYTRELLRAKASDKTVDEQLATIKNSAEGFQWEIEADDETEKKHIGTLHHQIANVTETLTFIVHPHKTNYDTYLIYEVNGKDWNEQEWQNFSSLILNRIQTFFDINSPIFSSVNGNVQDTEYSNLDKYANDFVEAFSAQKIEGLNEETFVSLSAYTDDWETSIQSKEKNINLQIALRSNERLGGRTTVTIGTPIITSEY
ncbi:YwmB family TATA-box binding protein [Anaerobacillus sp. MEB173]|uniref:YwmB family TATA-box binding protein n=1 Tax=Anaerobacillus sp. MEB173 TaxID=3383345 RepID=UPI003F93A069